MRESTNDTLAESPQTSLISLVGSSPQPSERGVAQHSSIQLGEQSYESSQVAVMLLTILQGAIRQIRSDDQLWFAKQYAVDACLRTGMDEDDAKIAINLLVAAAKRHQPEDPLSSVF